MEKRTIGTFLSALRKASGLTQKQLADKLNVSDKAVSRWERDECAPDLSLIPILAEIYGVTSDEILQGKRNDPEISISKADPVKAELQRRHLLRCTHSKFRIRSIGCSALTVIGLIVVYILNFEFSHANAGLLIGSIIFLSAIVGQIASLLSALSAIRSDEWVCNDLSDAKESMLLVTEAIVSITVLILAGLLPLLGKSRIMVPFVDCVTGGVGYILIAAVLCFAVCTVINFIFFSKTRSKVRRLRLWCSSILSVLMIILLLGHTLLNAFLVENRHTYADCREFQHVRAFQRYMATPLCRDGLLSYWCNGRDKDSNAIHQCTIEFTGETFLLKQSDIVKQLIPSDAPSSDDEDRFSKEYGYEFEQWNLNVVHYEFTDGKEPFPIYTFTLEQFEASNRIILLRNLQFGSLYLLPIAVISTIYLILRKRKAA